MTSAAAEQPDTATLAAAEGLAALGLGDTSTATLKFAAAGEALLREAAGKPAHADKTLLRFLAASQFYKGGEYRRALELAQKAEARILPAGVRDQLPKFLRDAADRADPGYRERMRARFAKFWAAGECRRLLDLLKDHPYVYDPGPLAFLRAYLCEELGLWRAAAAFYARAIPAAKDPSDFMILAVGRVLALPSQGRAGEAWEYISRLRELMPNAVTNFTASYVQYARAIAQTAADPTALHREQLVCFEAGLDYYEGLLPERREYREMGQLALGAFNAALLAAKHLGEEDRGRWYIDRMARLVPGMPVLGNTSSSDRSALEVASAEAVQLAVVAASRTRLIERTVRDGLMVSA